MTAVEISNNITNKRVKYEDNIAIISKLKKMLVEDNNTSKKLIEEAIEKVKEEQVSILEEFNVKSIGELLVKEKKAKENVKFANMRRFKYKSLSSKDIESLMSYKKGNDDITEVLTSDMKKEQEDNKIIDYDDEIIEIDDFVDSYKENVKINDDKTDVLTSNINDNDIYKNARIEFNGGYYLYYNNGNNSCYCKLNEEVLKRNYDVNGAFDFNIIGWLKDIDSDKGTNFYDRYMNHKIPVFYNLEETRKNRPKKSNKNILSNASINRLKTIVDREKEDREFTNVTVKDVKKKKFGVAVATVGLAAMALLGAFGFSKAKKVYSNNTATISTIDDAGASDADYESVELDTTAMINNNVDSIELNDSKEDTIEKTNVEEKKETETISETKIGDIVQFSDDIDLYYASTDVSPRGNTSYLNADNYRVGLISIVKDGEVKDLIDSSDVSLEEIKQEAIKEYGNDVVVSINYDLVDNNGGTITQYLGWSDGEEIGKVLVK